jgi:tagaturonate reductase
MRFLAAAGKINYFLERAIPLLTPIGVMLGVLLPALFLNLRPFILVLFGTMTLSGALKLRAKEMGRAVSSPLPIILFFVSAHIIMPLVVFFLSKLIFYNDPDTVSGYVLLYSVPTAVTAFIWISVYKGDRALSLSLIMLDTLLAPLVVPGTVRLLLRTSISLDMTGMAVSLVFMVLIPTVAGVALNEFSHGKIPALISPVLNPFSKVCMVLVIAANSAAVAPQINFNNPRLLLVSAICIGFSALGFAGGKLTGMIGRNTKEKQITLLFASGLRNTSAAMTLSIEFFPLAAALPSVLGIIFQQTMAAIMSRVLLGKRKDNT